MAGLYDVGKLVATLGLNTTPFMAGANAAGNKMREMQNSMMMIGRATTRFITIPMALAGGAAVNAQKDFENSMTKIIGLVGISRDTVASWKSEIFDISRETGRGPRELGDALYFVTSAGFRGSEALDILHKSAMAAAGGMGETKDIADLVTSAMYAYRKSNLSATEAMDAVIASVREGKVEVTDLINSMGKVFPIASKFGVSINEVGAAFASMTRSGTEADKASTHLRAILNQMMSPSEQVKKNLAGLAMGAEEFQDTLMNDGLIVALTKLNTAIKGDPRAYANIFQNIRALTGVLDLMGDNMEENIRIFERMKNANGELKKLFEEVQHTTQFKLDKALANLGITLIELGEILKDPVVNLLEQLTGWLQKVSDWLNGMTEAQKRATLAVAGFVAVIGPALAIVSRLSMMFLGLVTSIGGIIAILAVVTGAFLLYRKTLNDTSRGEVISNNIKERTNKLIGQEAEKIKALYRVAKNDINSKEDRKKAIEELQRLAPAYFGHLDTEKTKIEALSDAYEDYTTGVHMKATIDALSQAMVAERDAIMQLERDPYESFTGSEKVIARKNLFWQNVNQKLGQALGQTEHTWVKFDAAMDNMANDQINSHESYLTKYGELLADQYKKYNEFQDMMKAARAQEVSDGVPEIPQESPMSRASGGYLYDLQQRIKAVQEEALGVSREDLTVKLDKLRALQRELAMAEGLSNQYGEIGMIQNKMAIAQSMMNNLSGEALIRAKEYVDLRQKELDMIELAKNGLGDIEIIDYQVAEIQERITNATAEEAKNLKMILALLYQKQDVLTEMPDPFGIKLMEESGRKGSKLWKEQLDFNKKTLEGRLKYGQFYNNLTVKQQEEMANDIKDIDQDIQDQRIQNYQQTINAVQDLFGGINALLQAQMNTELRAAGDNQEKKLKIQKEYYQKMKKWSIAQALINGALAITNIWANMAWNPVMAGIATAIAAASIAAQVATINAQSFAKGGLVYGETLATVGDYPGASSNPEVIAPLSDLKKLLKSDGMASGTPKFIKLVAEGKDLTAVIDMERLIQNTY